MIIQVHNTFPFSLDRQDNIKAILKQIAKPEYIIYVILFMLTIAELINAKYI